MKEIIFRAWDNELTKMLISWNHPQDDNNLFWANAYWLHLMQYTWLKDKNWVKIFEWDVCHYCWANKVIIEFTKWAFDFKVLNTRMLLYNSIEVELEIIWNIYENNNLINNLE